MGQSDFPDDLEEWANRSLHAPSRDRRDEGKKAASLQPGDHGKAVPRPERTADVKRL
jgi:hypothetical protein